MSLFRTLLTNGVSRLFGRIASTRFPVSLQRQINRRYIAGFSIDMGEFAPAESYPTLNALFTRGCAVPRTFDADPAAMISPCDALIVECGDVRGLEMLQIKGMQYGLQELLGPYYRASSCRDGQFVNFYLSPRDYHRYHAPCDLTVRSATHIPGLLYPVNIPALERIPALYVQNERVVLECAAADGRLFYLVYVGALNVGTMRFVFDPSIATNVGKKLPTHTTYENLTLAKGAEMGRFEMGSTVVMVMPDGMAELTVGRGAKVRYGMTIGRMEKA